MTKSKTRAFYPRITGFCTPCSDTFLAELGHQHPVCFSGLFLCTSKYISLYFGDHTIHTAKPPVGGCPCVCVCVALFFLFPCFFLFSSIYLFFSCCDSTIYMRYVCLFCYDGLDYGLKRESTRAQQHQLWQPAGDGVMGFYI